MFDDDIYRIGFGTAFLTDEEGTEAIISAIEAGYRHIDTARVYDNESEVGDAIAAASVDRDELFVATKVAYHEEPEPTPEYIRSAIGESTEKLGIETIDLLYHHWPRERPKEIKQVLPVLEALQEEGVVDRIGVSNYRIEDLEDARDIVDTPLYANQVEMHPLLQQDELYEWCREQDIYVIAYSPVARGEVFDVPEIVEIAQKHDTTPAVVSIAWLYGREGVVPIPRSSDEDHIRQNLAARDLELDAEDRERIRSIEATHRCEDREFMDW